MNKIYVINKTLLALSFTTALFLGSPVCSQAFMGMGDQGGSPPQAGNQANGMVQDQMEEAVSKHGSQSQEAVATVNGAPITMAELMANIQTIMQRKYSDMEMTDDLARRIRYNALEELALEKLAYQRARDIGALPDEKEIDARLEKTIAAAGGREKFQEKLAEKGKNIDNIRQEIARFLAIKNTVEQEVADGIEISEKKVNSLYQEKKGKFATPEKVTITDIVFFLDPEDDQAWQQVKAVRQQLLEGLDGNPEALEAESFAIQKEVNVSEDNKKEHYELAREMEPGSISRPVNIDGTLHLIKLDRYQPREEADPEKVKAYLRNKLEKSKRRELLTQWRRDLMDNADIEIKHELLKKN